MIKFLHFRSIFRSDFWYSAPLCYGLPLAQILFKKRKYFRRYQGGAKMAPPLRPGQYQNPLRLRALKVNKSYLLNVADKTFLPISIKVWCYNDIYKKQCSFMFFSWKEWFADFHHSGKAFPRVSMPHCFLPEVKQKSQTWDIWPNGKRFDGLPVFEPLGSWRQWHTNFFLNFFSAFLRSHASWCGNNRRSISLRNCGC